MEVTWFMKKVIVMVTKWKTDGRLFCFHFNFRKKVKIKILSWNMVLTINIFLFKANGLFLKYF